MALQLRARAYEARTKGEVHRLRAAGFVPVSVQHRGDETVHLQVEAKPLEEYMHRHGEAAMVELAIEPDGARHTALVHNVQRDPISRRLLQVSMQRVVRGEPIKAHVPILLQGKPEAVSEGTGVLQVAHAAVEVRALPPDLPEHFTLDVSGMNVGDELRVADLPLGKGIEALTAPETVVVSLTRSKAAFLEEPAAELAEEEAPTAAGEEAA